MLTHPDRIVPPVVHEVLSSPGEPLDRSTGAEFGRRFGRDFSSVRVHTSALAAESTKAVQATAYAVGTDLVFGPGRYAPRTPEGRKLLAHELTHVVQTEQSGGPRRKVEVGRADDPAEAEAERVSTLISKDAILPTVSAREPIAARSILRRSIFSEIAGLFAGDSFSEKELQDYLTLLDRTGKIEDHTDSDNKARAIANAWRLGGSAYSLSPQRKILLIKEMQSGYTGGDDERAILEILERSDNTELGAIFGSGGIGVTALDSDFGGEEREKLHDFFERRFDGGMEAMLKGQIKAVGEPLALGATKPKPTLYEMKLLEAYERLSGVEFGPTGGLLPQNLCSPELQESTGGSHFVYWYDKEFWEPASDKGTDLQHPEKGSCKLRLLSGKSPSAAIDALFNHQNRWQIDCAQFVEIFHLYALRHTLGEKKFDDKYQGKVTLELRRRFSTGVETKVLYSRDSASQGMKRSTDGQQETKGINQLLAEAPIGSRVRWTNKARGAQGTDWQNENSAKIGPDKYAAHPLFKVRAFVPRFPFLLGKDYALSRAEIEKELAQAIEPNATDSYIKQYVFISEIEYFVEPAQ
ncbi:MAG TPA: DUF4157 domain-containing protein [Isosphaeraceae bacterium]|nr:DUF4157 domain-containing protein [Isosphaeraceae bacterium]